MTKRPERKPLPSMGPRLATAALPRDELQAQLREASADLGFGSRAGDAAAPSPPAPDLDMKPLVLLVPGYLFDALAQQAAARRVTKKYLILEALQARGYRIDPADLEEDGRRNRS